MPAPDHIKDIDAKLYAKLGTIDIIAPDVSYLRTPGNLGKKYLEKKE